MGIISTLLVFSSIASGQTLSHRGVYERCHSKLVREAVRDDDPLANQINAGTLTGTEACVQLLRLAQFNSNGRIPNHSNPVRADQARKIVHSMNDLHASWLSFRSYNGQQSCRTRGTNSISDPLEPALFFTKALFDASTGYDQVVTSKDSLRAIREIDQPGASIFDAGVKTGPESFPMLPANFKLTPNGQILGVKVVNASSATENPEIKDIVARGIDKDGGETKAPRVAKYKVLQNNGAGALSTFGYLRMTFSDDPTIFPNVESMPRIWSKSVFSDFLCRDLPVIDDVDTPAVSTGSGVLPFRQSKACIQCHASMDQLVGVVRNMRHYRDTGTCNNTDNIFGANFLFPEPPKITTVDKTWSPKMDPQYRQKPTFGRFLFKTYNNSLINKELNGLSDLGTAIAATNDYYLCAARRYYRYFTGIDVTLKMSEEEAAALPPDQKFYRDRVIRLGLDLKGSKYGKDPMKMIEAIFALPEYQMRDMNMIRKAQGN